MSDLGADISDALLGELLKKSLEQDLHLWLRQRRSADEILWISKIVISKIVNLRNCRGVSNQA